MRRLELALVRALTDLDVFGAAYALVGGLAVSAHAEPRLTRDVDVAVAVRDDIEAERLVHAFTEGGYRPLSTVEQQATARLATVRMEMPREFSGVLLDLLFASSGIEPEIAAAAERIQLIPGLVAPVATRGDLIALKLLARDDRMRPQDYDDLRRLIETAGPPDLDRVRAMVRLIAERGYARGRDLETAFDEVVRDCRPSSG